jgi:hypothetical protein
VSGRHHRAVKELSIKGVAVRQLLDTYEEMRGKPFREDVIAATPGPAGEALRVGGIIAAGMVPMEWYRAVLTTAAELSRGGVAFTRDVGRRSAERDIGTIHRMVFRLMSPDLMSRQIPRLLGLYFDGGRGVVESREPGRLRIRFTEMHGFDALVWNDFFGGIEAMLAAAGAKSPRVRVLEGGTFSDAVIDVVYR